MKRDPDEFEDVSGNARHAAIVEEMKGKLLARFRETHPEAPKMPASLSTEDQLDFFLTPRDSSFSGSGPLDVKYNVK